MKSQSIEGIRLAYSDFDEKLVSLMDSLASSKKTIVSKIDPSKEDVTVKSLSGELTYFYLDGKKELFYIYDLKKLFRKYKDIKKDEYYRHIDGGQISIVDNDDKKTGNDVIVRLNSDLCLVIMNSSSDDVVRYLSKEYNESYSATISAKLHMHTYDAINIKAHQTKIKFEKTGCLIDRSDETTYDQDSDTDYHPDCIQLIPHHQYLGGILHDTQIIGAGKDSYAIKAEKDPKLQGILASDGRFSGLVVRDLKMKLQHNIAIHINGLINGTFERIIIEDPNNFGSKLFRLYPLRIGGGANIFIRNFKGQTEKETYSEFSDNKNNSESENLFSKVKIGKNYISPKDIDMRHLSNYESYLELVEGKENLQRIYEDFDIENFYKKLEQFTVTRKRKTYQEDVRELVSQCDKFVGSKGIFFPLQLNEISNHSGVSESTILSWEKNGLLKLQRVKKESYVYLLCGDKLCKANPTTVLGSKLHISRIKSINSLIRKGLNFKEIKNHLENTDK